MLRTQLLHVAEMVATTGKSARIKMSEDQVNATRVQISRTRKRLESRPGLTKATIDSIRTKFKDGYLIIFLPQNSDAEVTYE